MTLGRAQLKALGCPDFPIAVIPHPFGLRSRAEVRAIAEQCVADIARLAVQSAAAPGADAEVHAVRARRAARVDAPADQEAFDAMCRERRWTDGLPLVAPTELRVERMLAHTRHAPDAVIANVAPGFGIATVEAIAINAVMAGCLPAYLPVLLAAVGAMSERIFNLQGIQATTNPATPWLIVNGPLARELGVNSGLNCLGQGTWANATMGRALRLIMQNIGGALAGDMDRATHGQPGKYSFCCAENEAASPWEPLHVERGFALADSTVTVVGAAGTHNMNSHAKDAADLLRIIADSMTFPTGNDYHFGGQPWLILSPEHADVLHRGGLSKADVKERLWEMTRLAVTRLAARDYARMQHTRRGELGEFRADTTAPISRTQNDIGIVVTGGPGTHSVYVPTFGQTRAVTRRIDEAR